MRFHAARDLIAMKARWPALAVAATLALAIPTRGQSTDRAASSGPVTAFLDISVIPMDTEHVLAHQTVLVRDGKIIKVGPTNSVHPPSGSIVVRGQDKFLIPGMADMHTHVDRKEML